jgi:hypothetical protein
MKLITILLSLAFIYSCQHVEYITATDEDQISRAPASIDASENEEPKKKRKQTYSQKYLKRKYEENLTE